VSYYQELKPEQMKRAHRFLYRVAFKMDMSIMLFRVDIIRLLHKIIKGPGGLDPASKTYKEWDELVRHILRKCVKKIQEHPELIVEMLFSKTTYTANFFQYGYESQTIESKARAAAELEVKPGFEWEQQIGVVVGALLDRNEGHLLEWLKSQLSSAEIERRSWEGASEPIQSVETDAGETPPVPADPPKAPSIGKIPPKRPYIQHF
jgi:replication fork protection complex subunit Tof1/Swi1